MSVMIIEMKICDVAENDMLTAGNISAIANKIMNTALLARGAGWMDTMGLLLPTNGSNVNAPNDQRFAQIIVTALNQAKVSPKVQAAAFAQALAQALTTSGDVTETPDIIIAAALAANQTDSISQGFAQVREVSHVRRSRLCSGA